MYIYTNILVFHEMLQQLWRLPVAQLYSLNEPTTTNSPLPLITWHWLADNTPTQTSCDVMATGYACCWDGITSGYCNCPLIFIARLVHICLVYQPHSPNFSYCNGNKTSALTLGTPQKPTILKDSIKILASFPGSPGLQISIAGRAWYLFYVSMM